MARTTKIDDVTLRGASGEAYRFRVYVWGTKFKALPGVYLVAARTMDPGQPAQYAPLLVGEAADVSTVMVDHPRDECFQMYLANVIGVLHEEDGTRRAAIVADLATGLEPPCNSPDPE